MVAMSVVTGAIYIWPQYIIQTAGINGLWSLFTTAGISMAVLALQIAWVNLTKSTPFAVVVRNTWGVFGMWVVVSMTGILCMTVDSVMLALFGQMLHVFFYPLTPMVVPIILIGLAGVWIAMRSLNTVARNVQFWFPLILLSFGFVLFLSFRNIRFPAALLPSPTIVIPQWLRATFGTWFLYANGAVVASLVPHIHWARRARPVLWTTLAIGFQSMVLVVVLVTVVSTVGPAATAQLQWPMVYVFSLVSVKTFFFKGIGMFVIITWTTALVLYLAVHIYCFSWNVQAMVDASSSVRRWIALGAGLMVITIAILIPSAISAGKILFGVLNPADISWTVGVTVLSVIVAWVRHRRNKHSWQGRG